MIAKCKYILSLNELTSHSYMHELVIFSFLILKTLTIRTMDCVMEKYESTITK